jgi:hypothetical protein
VAQGFGFRSDFLLPSIEFVIPPVLVACLLISRSPNKFHRTFCDHRLSSSDQNIAHGRCAFIVCSPKILLQ